MEFGDWLAPCERVDSEYCEFQMHGDLPPCHNGICPASPALLEEDTDESY